MPKFNARRRSQPGARAVVAYLQVDGASKAAEFYQRAFGATEVAASRSTTRAGRCTFTCTSTAAR
jgi:hypothetical protein